MTTTRLPSHAISAGAVFLAFLRLGLTSFGGPVAHIGYFRDAFVLRRRWISDAAYADLVALCQFLPGPASSQVGMGIGLELAGLRGAIAAFLGFTLPSAIVMALIGIGLTAAGERIDPGILSGLAIVAVAVVAEAVRGMAVSLASGRLRTGIMLAAAAACLAVPGSLMQLAVLVGGGLLGYAFGAPAAALSPEARGPRPSRALGVTALVLFALLLIGLPLLAAATQSRELGFLAGLYRAGSLVFGGGHVVLPLLQDAVVTPGFVSDRSFLAGYGAVQAMPGPLFSLSAYLGAAAGLPGPVTGAALAVAALFAPAFLLIVGTLPFWHDLRRMEPVRRALTGVNAAVVGLLAAALYHPVFTTAIHTGRDLAFAVVCYALLTVARLPAWLVVVLAAAAGWLMA